MIASMSILLLEMARRARLEDLVQERLSRSEPTPSGGWGPMSKHVKACQNQTNAAKDEHPKFACSVQLKCNIEVVTHGRWNKNTRVLRSSRYANQQTLANPRECCNCQEECV